MTKNALAGIGALIVLASLGFRLAVAGNGTERESQDRA